MKFPKVLDSILCPLSRSMSRGITCGTTSHITSLDGNLHDLKFGEMMTIMSKTVFL